jgi:predicted DNA-binding transcriptional regulator YafY
VTVKRMNRFDRVLGLLLHLRTGKVVSALDLAQHFGVSRRTIYRDMEMLSALGVPVYAERGHAGGFRLLEGYFLPPVMFSKGEAVSLLLSVTLFRSLRSKPSLADLETAQKKTAGGNARYPARDPGRSTEGHRL